MESSLINVHLLCSIALDLEMINWIEAPLLLVSCARSTLLQAHILGTYLFSSSALLGYAKSSVPLKLNMQMNSFSFLLLKLTLPSVSLILYILLSSVQVRNVAVMVDAFLCLPVYLICHLNLTVHFLYHFSDFFSQSIVLFP